MSAAVIGLASLEAVACGRIRMNLMKEEKADGHCSERRMSINPEEHGGIHPAPSWRRKQDKKVLGCQAGLPHPGLYPESGGSQHKSFKQRSHEIRFSSDKSHPGQH